MCSLGLSENVLTMASVCSKPTTELQQRAEGAIARRPLRYTDSDPLVEDNPCLQTHCPAQALNPKLNIPSVKEALLKRLP